MAEKKKNSRANNVRIVGYLKENNLEQITKDDGTTAIRGSLIVATDKISSYKIQFYVSSVNSSNEASADYERMEALLPQNTITIASFLKNNSETDFEAAAAMASKVWIMARFDEYATRSGERVNSMITLKGSRGGFASEDKFQPTADFKADIYINKMTPEYDADNNATGRIWIEGYLPKYDKSVDVIDFVAINEYNVSKFISENWKAGDSVYVEGQLVNIQERILADENAASTQFGRPSAPQYETRFIRERQITGGAGTPKRTAEEGAITAEEVKNGLAEREVKMARNGAKAKQSPNNASNGAAAPAKKGIDATAAAAKKGLDVFDF